MIFSYSVPRKQLCKQATGKEIRIFHLLPGRRDRVGAPPDAWRPTAETFDLTAPETICYLILSLAPGHRVTAPAIEGCVEIRS